MLRVSLIAIVALVPLAAVASPGRRADDAPLQDLQAEAAALLARAEELASKAHYKDAHLLYQKIAERYGDTEAGAIAKRRAHPSAFLGWADLVRHGPSKNRVDVVLMGDGYELDQQDSFDKLADDVPQLFERNPVFREYWSYFNVLRANLVSAEGGIDGFGREYETALNAHVLPTYSGHTGVERARVLQMLAELPEHDSLAIAFVKNGGNGTGGGGIAALGSGLFAGSTLHEFGHGFAGLGDEYATEQSHVSGAVGSTFNVSGTDDPKLVPWAHWIAAKHPSIGIYQGAGGRERGAWKPTASGCVMDNGEFFCPVCREALVLRIYSFVDPIDGSSPPPPPPGIREPIVMRDDPVRIRVRLMQPAEHELELTWWVLPEVRTGDPRSSASASTSKPRVASTAADAATDRRQRGPLAAIADKPWLENRTFINGEHVLTLLPSELEPGRYRVICRARDTTRLRDDKFPWVLKDDAGVLESERTWWLAVAGRQK